MKVLSLNGGGSKGYMSVYILAKLEEALGNKYKTCELFDLIAGVSTGSILGALLAKGHTARETMELYRQFIPKIFSNKRGFVTSLFRAKYKRDALLEIAKQYLDFDLKTARTRYMAYAVSIGPGEITPKFWKSWKDSIKAYDVVLASSAAPTYFDPYVIDGTCYVDGGMAANNPSTCAIAQALRLGATAENICNVNITCDTMQGYNNPTKLRGLMDWAAKAIDVSMNAASGMDEYQAATILGDKNIYIQPQANLSLDCRDFMLMEKIAEEAWQKHKEALIENISVDK